MATSERCALITGAAGFAGSHLVKKLLETDWQVVAVDNLCVGKLDHLHDVISHPRLTVAMADVCQRDAVRDLMTHFSPRVIFHLAAHHFIPYCEAHASEAVRVNILGTQTLAETVQQMSTVERFIFVSTGDVYVPSETPHHEDSLVAPGSVYGTTKLAGEHLLQVAAKKCDTAFTVVRMFNIYGPQETNPHIIPEIITQLKLQGGDRLSLGSVWPKRDFIFVKDVVDGLISLVDAPEGFDVFNIGTGHAYAIEELVQVIGTLLQRTIHIDTDLARVRPVERPHLQADISKITRTTGWAPKWNIETGLAHLLTAEALMNPSNQAYHAA